MAGCSPDRVTVCAHRRRFDDDITRWPSDRRARAGIGLVPEGRRVFAGLTVLENLLVPIRSRHGDRSWLRDAFGLFPDLEAVAGKPAGLLSGGQQQMLAVARAMMLRPKLILLDEPTMGLAPMIVAEVLKAAEKLAAQGVGVIVADESARLVVPIATHLVALRGGRVVHSGPADREDLEHIEETLSDAYFG